MSLIYSEELEFHLKIKKGDIGEYVLLCGDPGRTLAIAAYLDDAALVASNREYTIYTGSLCGVPVSVCSTGIGGPSAAIALEELVHCGAHTFIRIGTSGGMDPALRGGDLVIATGAIRMEGTTKEYAPIEFPAVANLEVTNALVQAAKAAGASYMTGVVQSKDSFYGQHAPSTMPVAAELTQKWEAWLRCDAKASEMEAAALFVIGSVRRVRVGCILLVLANQSRQAAGLDNPVSFDADEVIRVGVEAMRLLILS